MAGKIYANSALEVLLLRMKKNLGQIFSNNIYAIKSQNPAKYEKFKRFEKELDEDKKRRQIFERFEQHLRRMYLGLEQVNEKMFQKEAVTYETKYFDREYVEY